VLVGAPAAAVEERTGRLPRARGPLEHGFDDTARVTGLDGLHPDAQAVAGMRARHQEHLAFVPEEAQAAIDGLLDLRLDDVSPSHARWNRLSLGRPWLSSRRRVTDSARTCSRIFAGMRSR